MKLKGLPYFGGKSPVRNITKWIVNQIGFDPNKGYVEPFCGMCGVYLSRDKVQPEILNDKCEYLINWWQCIQNRTDELRYLVHNTPRSREMFVDAAAKLRNESDDIKRALWYHIVMHQSIDQSIAGSTEGSWGIIYKGKDGKTFDSDTFIHLANRLKNTQIHNMDAIELLESISNSNNYLIYCDPPYFTSTVSKYGENSFVDKDKLTEVFKAQKSDVAISGYRDEWDHLGWVRTTHKSRYMAIKTVNSLRDMTNEDREREEVLWMNFEPRGYVNPEFDNLFT